MRARRAGPTSPVVLVPLLWLLLFVLGPTLVVLKISFSQSALAQPPYVPVLDIAAGWEGVRAFFAGLSKENYAAILADQLYLASYLRSLQVAAIATVLLVLVGFPLAYALARAPQPLQSMLLLAVMLPFWTAFLIRIYALINIFQREGLVNQALLNFGLIDAPIAWLASDKAIIFGLVYSYLPFMVLPLYAALQKMDPALAEAAADLGCPPWKSFWLITVPLSLPGLAAGALFCFVPIVGEFVVPDLLGGSSNLMIGQTLWTEFFANRDWPLASAVAMVMLAVLLAPILIYQGVRARVRGGER